MNKMGLKWISTSTPEILNNISSFIDYINDLDSFEDYDEADTLRDLLLVIPSDQLISTLIAVLNGDDGDYPFEHAICFPNVWFGLALNPDSRKELIVQLSAMDFERYVFTFLNGIDEGDNTPGEIAIRGVLDELHYPVPRDISKDWSPDGKYKRITRRKTVEFRADPVANFSGLMDAVLYYSNSFEFFIQPVTNAIDCISDENLLVTLMINELVSRGSVDSSLFEYAQCWIRLTNTPECAIEIEKQLSCLPGDSCVITYLNELYRTRLDYDLDMSLLVSLKGILERANVFVDCAPEKSSDK